MKNYINRTFLTSPNERKSNRSIISLIDQSLIYLIDMTPRYLFQMRRDLVVSCVGELVSNNTQMANVIVDVIALADVETQVNKTHFFPVLAYDPGSGFF